MRARFVPPHYRNELLLKLQRLQQGPRSVDEYFKDLETTLTKIDMYEYEESKIARFVSGLRREIQDVVELYEYFSLEKLVHLASKTQDYQLKNSITHFKKPYQEVQLQTPLQEKSIGKKTPGLQIQKVETRPSKLQHKTES